MVWSGGGGTPVRASRRAGKQDGGGLGGRGAGERIRRRRGEVVGRGLVGDAIAVDVAGGGLGDVVVVDVADRQ